MVTITELNGPAAPEEGSYSAMPGVSNVAAWSVAEVEAMLWSLELGHLAATFRANGINGKALMTLSSADYVQHLGLTELQARNIVAHLRSLGVKSPVASFSGGYGGGYEQREKVSQHQQQRSTPAQPSNSPAVERVRQASFHLAQVYKCQNPLLTPAESLTPSADAAAKVLMLCTWMAQYGRCSTAPADCASSLLQAGALLRDSLFDLQHAEQILVADKRLASAYHFCLYDTLPVQPHGLPW